jgi:DNA-binding NtrC family response regulator
MRSRHRASSKIVRGGDPSAGRLVGRILVVDDCEGSRTLLADILGMQGHSITAAPDGALAWRLLQRSRVSYGLVITDFMMPRMNGIELLEKILAAYPSIKVVLITGHLEDEITSRAQKMGAFAVLPKPCGLEQLHGIIRLALQKWTPALSSLRRMGRRGARAISERR